MEQRLITEMAKLRGGKTRLKEIRGEYQDQIRRLREELSDHLAVVRQIDDLISDDADEPVDNGEEKS